MECEILKRATEREDDLLCERACLRTDVTGLQRELVELRQTVTDMYQERDALRGRVKLLETQEKERDELRTMLAHVNALLETERRSFCNKLDLKSAALRAELKRARGLEKQLAEFAATNDYLKKPLNVFSQDVKLRVRIEALEKVNAVHINEQGNLRGEVTRLRKALRTVLWFTRASWTDKDSIGKYAKAVLEEAGQ